jgi:hypothetical protein
VSSEALNAFTPPVCLRQSPFVALPSSTNLGLTRAFVALPSSTNLGLTRVIDACVRTWSTNLGLTRGRVDA